ncbi:MAG TPA: Gfo/Idh/MocA family oxidoreductase [Chloroflexota bacterium]|nr:Gfo/Idh/MocA family oxidoreductase [Chloroflexota bacterium]
MTGNTPRPLRIGAIGVGLAMEKLHWPALERMADRFQITAFADTSRETAEHFTTYNGASMEAYHADYHDLLQRDDVDAVVILLPIPLLYEAARASLEAGKHALCEKPTGSNEEQGHAFLQLEAQFPQQKLLIAENFFYRDDLRLARSLLDEGAIGRTNVMTWRQAHQAVPRPGSFSSTPWRQQPQYRGGVHLDGGVHMIAQIRLLCGDVQRLHAFTQHANSTFGGPSDLLLNMTFVNRSVGSYVSVHSEVPVPPDDGNMRLYGSEGVMLVGSRDGTRTVSIHRPDRTTEEHRIEHSDGGYYNEWLNFHEAIMQDAPIIGTVTQSFHNMLIVLRALDSAEGSGVVEMEDVPGGIAEQSIPLWKPHGATGLFDGLPCNVTKA